MPRAFLLFTAFACGYQDDDDECTEGERRCAGMIAYVCKRSGNSCSRECWSDDSGYKWTPTGSCGGQPTLPDPKCDGQKQYCDGLVAVICAAGFAVGRDNGDVTLRADGNAFPDVLHVGDRIPFRSVRASSCGSADVVGFAIIARAAGTARVLTDTNEIAARLEVVP